MASAMRPSTMMVLFLAFLGGIASLASAATVVEVTGTWPTSLFENSTAYADGAFTGPTNGSAADIANNRVTFDFASAPITDHAGAEFYVYESAGGNAEFHDMDVLVSSDGAIFISVKSTEGAPVAYALPGGIVPRLSGDTVFSDAGYLVGTKVKAYDLSGLGTDYQALYVRVQGNITDENSGGFDLDAVGVLPAPEPATLALLALGGLALIRRRRSA